MTEQSLEFFQIGESSCSQMLYKVGGLKIFVKFTRKYLHSSLILIKLQVGGLTILLKRDSSTGIFQ